MISSVVDCLRQSFVLVGNCCKRCLPNVHAVNLGARALLCSFAVVWGVGGSHEGLQLGHIYPELFLVGG